MKRAPTSLAATALALALAACAADQDAYPSLARRDVERAASAEPAPIPPAPAQPADPVLAPRLDQLIDRAGKAHERFAARRGRAEQLTSSALGSAIASESWAVASVALADLESTRSEAMIALADLDQLYAAARIGGTEAGAIAEARDRVMGWIGEEDRVLATLRDRLGG